MISDGKIPGALNVTTISYHDWAGIVWFIFLTTLSVYGICNGGDFGPVVLVLSFILLMNSLNIRQLRRQKASIEEMIKRCEDEQ